MKQALFFVVILLAGLFGLLWFNGIIQFSGGHSHSSAHQESHEGSEVHSFGEANHGEHGEKSDGEHSHGHDHEASAESHSDHGKTKQGLKKSHSKSTGAHYIQSKPQEFDSAGLEKVEDIESVVVDWTPAKKEEAQVRIPASVHEVAEKIHEPTQVTAAPEANVAPKHEVSEDLVVPTIREQNVEH